MYKVNTVIFGALIAAGIIGVSALVAQSPAAVKGQDQSTAEAILSGGAFAKVSTEITDEQIVITIDRNPEFEPTEALPPLIVVPPNETGGEQNVTVIEIPQAPEPGNETAPTEGGNVTIIEPGGNISIIEDGNATIIDNETAVIVSPPDRNVTETPGDVVVIDPPVANETAQEPCGCPPAGVEGAAPDIQLPPAAVGNVTEGGGFFNNTNITVTEPVVAPLPPADENAQQAEESNDNGNGGGGGGGGGNGNGNGGEPGESGS